jgi:polyhydroxybutyrate depolymerase
MIQLWRLSSLLVVAACGGGTAMGVADPNVGTSAPVTPSGSQPAPADGGTAGAGASTASDASTTSGAAGAVDQSHAGAGATATVGRSASAAPADAATPADAAMPASGSAGSDAADSGGTMPDAQSPASCPAKTSYNPGDNRVMLQHGGRSRRFTVYLPSSVQAGMPAPLVLDFHGNGSNGAQEESSSGWKAKADREAFIVAYPDGVGNGWNVGNCCGEALMSMVDDVGFTREIVKTISAAACVDAKRVYATGLSNGAGLTHRLACEAADVFAAIAAASADLVTDPCKPSRPISELSVRGLTDTLVNYAGGNTGSTGWYSPGAKGTLMLWKDIDACTGTPDTSMQYCESYKSCEGGVEVTLCSLPNTGHILYDNSLGFNVPNVAWEMFKRQPMR